MKKGVLAIYDAFEQLGDSIRRNVYKASDERHEEWIVSVTNRKAKLHIKTPKEIKEGLKTATESFSTALKKIGVLKEKDTIKIESLGRGQFGEAYSINFSNTKYPSKVIKIYEELSDNLKNYYDSIFQILGETNAATFIKKARGHRADNTNVTEFHFSNLKSGFMVTENANNYKTPVTSNYNRFCVTYYDDMKKENYVNGKIVDMGGFMGAYGYGKITPHAVRRRVAKRLLQIHDKEEIKYDAHNKKHNFNYTLVNNQDPQAFYFSKFIKMFNREYKRALANKCPQASEVLKALDELSKDHIKNGLEKFLCNYKPKNI